MTTSTTALPNGLFMVAPGKLATAVVWMEMRERPRASGVVPLRCVLATDQHRETFYALASEIGTPWLWSSDALSPDLRLSTRYVALDDADRRVGIVALSEDGRDVEITHFGLVPTSTGAGLGRRMMAACLDRAWKTAHRVWLHTCNFDHPAALRFYTSCGFVPFASGFQIMDDPRLTGGLPADAAPQVPTIPSRDPDNLATLAVSSRLGL